MQPPSSRADPKQKTRYHTELEPDTQYHQITFGGCGFLLPYHFGAILCMFDNGISTDNAVGISGGSMAALAMLNGSDIYIGLRQGIVDLVNEGFGFILLGLNMLFMNFYFQYMWNYRCLHISHRKAREMSSSTRTCDFPLHDMSASHRLSPKDLNGRYHVQMVSIAAQDPTGNALDPLAKTVAGSYLDDSFLRLSSIPGRFGRAMQSMLVPVVIEKYVDDASIVQAACLSGGIPGITTFWPRYFDDHFCCLDRMTSAPININTSSADLTEFINTQTSSSSLGSLEDKKNVPGRVLSWQTMTDEQLSEAVKEASQVHMHTIVISPIKHDHAVFRGSDIGICGGYINPFPVFPWQFNNRKEAFIAGYRDMQKRIRNPKILDDSRAIKICEPIIHGNCTDDNSDIVTANVTKTVDSKETISDLIDFILYDSYAKDWKSPHFSMRIDGQFTPSHEAPQNRALSGREFCVSVAVCMIFICAMLWHPVYFLVTIVSVLAVGAVWIISYLLGVDRINRDIDRMHEEQREKDALSDDDNSEIEGLPIDTDDERDNFVLNCTSESIECNEQLFDGIIHSRVKSSLSSDRVLRSATKQKIM